MNLVRGPLAWLLPLAALGGVLLATWLLVPRQDAPFIYAFF
jgi:hypothetical protein